MEAPRQLNHGGGPQSTGNRRLPLRDFSTENTQTNSQRFGERQECELIKTSQMLEQNIRKQRHEDSERLLRNRSREPAHMTRNDGGAGQFQTEQTFERTHFTNFGDVASTVNSNGKVMASNCSSAVRTDMPPLRRQFSPLRNPPNIFTKTAETTPCLKQEVHSRQQEHYQVQQHPHSYGGTNKGSQNDGGAVNQTLQQERRRQPLRENSSSLNRDRTSYSRGSQGNRKISKDKENVEIDFNSQFSKKLRVHIKNEVVAIPLIPVEDLLSEETLRVPVCTVGKLHKQDQKSSSMGTMRDSYSNQVSAGSLHGVSNNTSARHRAYQPPITLTNEQTRQTNTMDRKSHDGRRSEPELRHVSAKDIKTSSIGHKSSIGGTSSAVLAPIIEKQLEQSHQVIRITNRDEKEQAIPPPRAPIEIHNVLDINRNDASPLRRSLGKSQSMSVEYYQQIIDDLLQQNDNLRGELQRTLQDTSEVQERESLALLKLEKAMTMISELKNLKSDVMLLKKQSTESEQRRLHEIKLIGDQKKELEIQFNSFHESNNKQKSDLMVQLAKQKRHIAEKENDLVDGERKIAQQSQQIADLLEERQRLSVRVQDSQKIIENLENHKTRMTSEFDQMKLKVEHYQVQLPTVRGTSHEASRDNSAEKTSNFQIITQNKASKTTVAYIPMRNRSASSLNAKLERQDEKQQENGQASQEPSEGNRSIIYDGKDSTVSQQQHLYNHNTNNQRQSSPTFETMPANYNYPLQQVQQHQQITQSPAAPQQVLVSDEQLLQRCRTLEKYCRDLLQSNKVLDMENKVAIAQLVNLLSPEQLSNFTAALRFVSNAPKTVYDEAPSIGKADSFNWNPSNRTPQVTSQPNKVLRSNSMRGGGGLGITQQASRASNSSKGAMGRR